MSTNIVKLLEYKEVSFLKRVGSLINGGVYPRALKSCEEFIVNNPGSTAAYEVRQEIHVKLGEYEQSVHDADKILLSRVNEKQGYFLKLLSLHLLLEKPRLALVSADHFEKKESYAQELEKTSAQGIA